ELTPPARKALEIATEAAFVNCWNGRFCPDSSQSGRTLICYRDFLKRSCQGIPDDVSFRRQRVADEHQPRFHSFTFRQDIMPWPQAFSWSRVKVCDVGRSVPGAVPKVAMMNQIGRALLLIAAAVFAATVSIVDLLLPTGIEVWVLYLPVILLPVLLKN